MLRLPRVLQALELERGQFAERALTSATVVGLLDPGDDRDGKIVAADPTLPVEDVGLEQVEGALHGGVSPAAPTRPIEPVSRRVQRRDECSGSELAAAVVSAQDGAGGVCGVRARVEGGDREP